MSSKTIAVLGTGTMGSGMAGNICRAGMRVQVWNRTQERAVPLAESGALVCDTVAEAVAGADVIVTMLWDAETVEETLREGSGHFASGAVLLQTTTVGVDGADRLAKVADELGLVYWDAPVQGTRGPAENGSLVVLASGPQVARAAVQPVLDAIGSRTIWLGEAGSGSRLKLATNAFVLSLTSAVAQSMAVARGLGLEPEQFLEALSGGSLESPYVKVKGAAMSSRTYDPAFGIEGGIKDADLILAACADSGVDPALLSVVRDQLVRTVEAGHAGEDIAAVYESYGTPGGA